MEEYRDRQQIWIHVQDSDFQEKLQHFLMYHYGSQMEVHAYEEYLEGLRPAANSLLLTDQVIVAEEFGQVVPLTMGEEVGGINLYQSGHKIARQILERGALAETKTLVVQEKGEKQDRPRGQVISVYSPIGGCGKTTFAMALSECLYEKTRERILYLNLEGASAWKLFFHGDKPYNLSDLLYSFLLDTKKGHDELLDRVLCPQEKGICFIQPCTSFEDLNLLTPEEVGVFVKILQENFDWIICDMNTAFHSVNRLFIQHSQRCFLISGVSREAQEKLQDFFGNLQVYEEIYHELEKKTRVLQRGKFKERREEREEYLPEEKELFSYQDKLLQYDSKSAYYQKVREIAMEEVKRAGETERLPIL